MIGFLYVVGIVIHFLIVAYIDAKGSEFFNITARKDTYFKGDRNVDVGMALAGGLLWPVLLVLRLEICPLHITLYPAARQACKASE